MSKKVAIVLSGCGVNDGSEIHEAVLTLLHLVKNGATPLFYAPSENQRKVVDHATGEERGESRSMLSEAARIARGDIKDISELNSSVADALVFPGGFGAALSLCDFAEKGADCSALPEVERVIKEFHSASKPIGFICIAPAIGARVLGDKGVELTIGTDAGTASGLEGMGAKHSNKSVNEIQIDEVNKVISTPAYMLANNIAEAESGIQKLCQTLLEMAN